MAKAARASGGPPAKKKESTGFAFRFPKVQDEPIKRDEGYSPRLQVRYNESVRPALSKEYGYGNAFKVPRVEKIVLNIGLGEACLLYTSPSPRD